MAVKVTGSLEGMSDAIVQQWIERIEGETIAELTERVETVYADARDNWPQPGQPGYDSSRSRAASRWEGRTPFVRRRTEESSRDGLRREVTMDGDVPVGRVWNDVSYAKFVKANSLGGRSAFVVLLRTPMRALGRKMARSLEKRITKALNDG